MTTSGTSRPVNRIRLGALCSASLFAIAMVFADGVDAQSVPNKTACAGDNGGITLSPGFCATVFADNLGHVRHMAVAPNGVLFVNTWSGRYYHNDTPPAGGFLIALKDNSGGGRADAIERFGPGVPEGSAGGTGVAWALAIANDDAQRSAATTKR